MLGSDSKINKIFPNIKNISLILLGKLREHNCEVKLTKNQRTFHRDNTPIIIIPFFNGNVCDGFNTTYV